jgi:hypothetical protein
MKQANKNEKKRRKTKVNMKKKKHRRHMAGDDECIYSWLI